MWLSGSILGRLGQNFERLSKKIRSLGRHISLKIHEPGGTKLKYLLYKKYLWSKIEDVQICQS